jgi:uncharacterized protein
MIIRIPPLQELTVWNTSKCNLRCDYCFVYELYKDIPRQEMDQETMDSLIHFAMHHLMMNGRIWFFGGEPLTSFETMKYITERCFAECLAIRFGLTTNCTLIDEEKAKWMKKFNYMILCSLDGSEILHNKHRKYHDGRGSFNDTWRGIQLVRKYLNRNPQIRWTVNIDTVEGVTEAMKNLIEQGLTNLAVDTVFEVEWDDDSLKILRNELIKMCDLLDKCYERGIPVFSMFVRDALTAIVNVRRVKWSDRCGLGQGTVGVTPKGEIVPCHRYVSSGQPVIGDVFKGFSAKRLEWMEKWVKYPPYSEKPDMCLDCNFKTACNGGCLACNYDLFGDPHIVPESYCKIKQLTVDVFRNLVLKYKDTPLFKQVYAMALGRPCVE